MAYIPVQVGDVVRLRKPHPCGSYVWAVTRIGADIGLRCQKCARRVMLPRGEFNKRVKTFISRAEPLTSAPRTASDEDSPAEV
jgi:hypothetical protein